MDLSDIELHAVNELVASTKRLENIGYATQSGLTADGIGMLADMLAVCIPQLLATRSRSGLVAAHAAQGALAALADTVAVAQGQPSDPVSVQRTLAAAAREARA